MVLDFHFITEYHVLITWFSLVVSVMNFILLIGLSFRR